MSNRKILLEIKYIKKKVKGIIIIITHPPQMHMQFQYILLLHLFRILEWPSTSNFLIIHYYLKNMNTKTRINKNNQIKLKERTKMEKNKNKKKLKRNRKKEKKKKRNYSIKMGKDLFQFLNVLLHLLLEWNKYLN